MKTRMTKFVFAIAFILLSMTSSNAFIPKLYFVQDLQLTSMCSDNPDQQRRWRVRNPNNFPLEITWEVYGTTQRGSLTVPAGDSYFFTNTIGGGSPNTTKIYWNDISQNQKSTVKASGGVKCEESFDVCKSLFYIDHAVSGDGISNIYSVVIDEVAKTATTKLFTTINFDAAHLALHPDGTKIYVIQEGGDNTIGYVDVATKSFNLVSKLKVASGITQVAIHPEGKLYFSSMTTDKVYVIADLANPTVEDLGKIQFENGFLDIQGADMAFSQSGDFYLSTIAYKGRIFHITGGKDNLKAEKIGNERNRKITGLAITNNGKGNFIHSSNGKDEMSLLDINTGNSIADLKLKGDLLKMNWGDMSSSCMDKITPDNPLGGCAAVAVVEFKQGLNAGGKTVVADRSNPNKALGTPQGADAKESFVSLGFGGHIVLKFSDAIINGNGNDLRVVETSYGNPTCTKYPENVEVFASQNGTTWVSIGTNCLDSEFDLGNLAWAQYVKLVDKSNPSNFPKDGDGYDVDGVVCLNGSKPVPPLVDCGTVVGGNSIDLWKGTELKAKGFGDATFSSERVGFVSENTMNSSIASGVGVKGQSSTEVSGYSTEIEFDATTGQSEVLSVGFGKNFTGAEITLGLFYGSESGAQSEQANVKAFDGDVEVGSFEVTSTSDLLVRGLPGFYTFKIKTTKPFNRLEFRGGGYKPVGGVAENAMRRAVTKGDYILHKIVPSCEPIVVPADCGDVIGGTGISTDWSKVKISAKIWGNATFSSNNIAYEIGNPNVNGPARGSGIGVTGGRFPEVDYNKNTGEAEVLRFDFQKEFTGATVTLKRFYGKEDANQSETGHWIAYNILGEEVGNGEFRGTQPLSTDGNLEFTFKTTRPFIRLDLKPGIYVTAGSVANTDRVPDNSDFLVNKIVPSCESLVGCGDLIGGTGIPADWLKTGVSGSVWSNPAFSSSNIAYEGKDGIGVKGGRFPEVDYNKNTGEAEVLRFDFQREFTGATIGLKRFYGKEDVNASQAETGHWIAYNAAGTIVGTGEFKGVKPLGTDGYFEFTFKANAPFTRLDLKPGVYVTAGSVANTDKVPDNSDFLVNKIIPTCEPITPPAIKQADLQVTQLVDKANAKVGDELNYTITVTNKGPNSAGSATKTVKLTNVLPSGLTLVSVQGATFVGNVADLGIMENNATKVVLVKVKTTQAGTIKNTVNVLAETPEDPNFSNNNASASTLVQAVVDPCPSYTLELGSIDNVPTQVYKGDLITYKFYILKSRVELNNVVLSNTFSKQVKFISGFTDAGVGVTLTDLSDINLGTFGTYREVVAVSITVEAMEDGQLDARFTANSIGNCGVHSNAGDNNVDFSTLVETRPASGVQVIGDAANATDIVRVYPNPFAERVTVEFPENFNGNLNIQVIGVSNSGSLYNRTVEVSNTRLFSFDLPSDLPAGMYILKINKEATLSEKGDNNSNHSISAKPVKEEETFKIYKQE